MTLTLTQTIPFCECCALLIANGDKSGCRDYYGHTHPAAHVPTGTVLTDDGADQPSTPWACGACGTTQDCFAYRMWADVVEPEHRHTYRADVSTHWCAASAKRAATFASRSTPPDHAPTATREDSP